MFAPLDPRACFVQNYYLLILIPTFTRVLFVIFTLLKNEGNHLLFFSQDHRTNVLREDDDACTGTAPLLLCLRDTVLFISSLSLISVFPVVHRSLRHFETEQGESVGFFRRKLELLHPSLRLFLHRARSVSRWKSQSPSQHPSGRKFHYVLSLHLQNQKPIWVFIQFRNCSVMELKKPTDCVDISIWMKVLLKRWRPACSLWVHRSQQHPQERFMLICKFYCRIPGCTFIWGKPNVERLALYEKMHS